jgi:3-phenylpropionate/cinnamic acid dioxygenase small subunit
MNEVPSHQSAAGAAKGSGGTADNEENLRLDNRVYDELKSQAAAARDPSGPQIFGSLKEKVDAFLFQEARLLDSKRYRDWAAFLTTDFIYWIPGSPDIVDPRLEGGVNFDDRRRIIDRITLIETNVQWAQVPRSRTCRTISNIEAFSAADSVVRVRSNVVIWEYRRGRAQSYIGWQFHEILIGTDPWRIRRKFIALLDCDQPQGNTTFIL